MLEREPSIDVDDIFCEKKEPENSHILQASQLKTTSALPDDTNAESHELTVAPIRHVLLEEWEKEYADLHNYQEEMGQFFVNTPSKILLMCRLEEEN